MTNKKFLWRTSWSRQKKARSQLHPNGCGTTGKGNGLSPFNIITAVEHSIRVHSDYRVYTCFRQWTPSSGLYLARTGQLEPDWTLDVSTREHPPPIAEISPTWQRTPKLYSALMSLPLVPPSDGATSCGRGLKLAWCSSRWTWSICYSALATFWMKQQSCMSRPF